MNDCERRGTRQRNGRHAPWQRSSTRGSRLRLRRRDDCRRIRHAGDDLIEHATCVADITESLPRIAHEAVAQQREQSGRHPRRQRFPVHVARQHCGERVRHILGVVPTLACEHFVEHDAKAQMSARRSTCLPLACSGAMYAAVPRMMPSCVACAVSVGEFMASTDDAAVSGLTALASPKSSTLTVPTDVP